MRIDHIAYRVKDREKTAQFFIDFFGYKFPDDLQTGFDIQFEDGSWTKCFALEPPEKETGSYNWTMFDPFGVEYHTAPEIFVSSGCEGSIVSEWVKNHNGGNGGIHHIAYQVSSVKKIMEDWGGKGFIEFATEEPMRCPGLVQVFTKPLELTGILYEFIEREAQGFCVDSVRGLMDSTKNNKF
jgi:catechol 2,3-dioxygenase-like lactoylglutathione lyase family enzyme